MEGDRYREASRTDVVMGFMKDHPQAPLLQESEPGWFFIPLDFSINCSYFLGCETERDTRRMCSHCDAGRRRSYSVLMWAEAPGAHPAHSFSPSNAVTFRCPFADGDFPSPITDAL